MLRNILAKLQLMFRDLHQKIIDMWSHRRSPYKNYNTAWSERDHQSLKWYNIQFPSKFETRQIFQKFILLNNHPRQPVGGHFARGENDKLPEMIDLASTSLSKSARLASKIKQKYGLFAKLSLAVIWAW